VFLTLFSSPSLMVSAVELKSTLDGRDTRTMSNLFLLRIGFSQLFLYQKDLFAGNKGFYSCFMGFCFNKIWIYG